MHPIGFLPFRHDGQHFRSQKQPLRNLQGKFPLPVNLRESQGRKPGLDVAVLVLAVAPGAEIGDFLIGHVDNISV